MVVHGGPRSVLVRSTSLNHFKDDEENYSKGITWYLDQMPRIRSDEIAIEKSPKYLIANRAPKRIKNLNKDIKERLKIRHYNRTLHTLIQL